MTLTLAGNKQLMAKRSTSIRGKTAKASNLNSVSQLQLVESPPMLPSRSTLPAVAASRADLSSPRGTSGTQSQPGGGMSAAPIALQAPVSSINATCHSIGTRDGINCPMNIVSDTPEPYLEPIKLLNKQSIEERQQNPSSVARSPISSVPSEKTVTSKSRQLTKSCFTGARFPSASSRPIPPPKVLLKRQPSTREEARRLPSERKAATTNNSQEEGAKKRELAYLIVDLQTGRTTISTKNKRTLDDSDVGLKSCKHNSSGEKSSRFPVRSFTMSVPGDQIKRPVVKPQLKPRPSRNTSQDSTKAVPQQLSTDGISTIPETTVPSSGKHSPEPPATMETGGSHDHHPHGGNNNMHHSDLLLKERPEIYVSTSTGDSDDEESRNDSSSAPAPPPIPPKRGLSKMVSLPPPAAAAGAASVSSTGGGVPAAALGRRLLRGGRTSLPASSIAKDLQLVNISRSDTDDSLTSSTEKPSSGSGSGSSHPKPAKNRLPPPKPRPYSERVISPPPPPSFPPPPRPVATSISLPTSPPDSRRTTSPVPPSSKSPSKSPPLSPNTGIRHSHSHQSLLPPGAGQGGTTQLRNRVLSDSNSMKSSGKPKAPKPPPPSRPPPTNSKLSQLIAEHRERSKSTVPTTSRGSLPTTISRVKPSISEPRLISTTMRSDSQSLTDLRTSESEDIDDIDVIPCSNISYVSTAELLGRDSSQTNEDRPSPLYEDIDALIPLPPPRIEGHNKAKSPHHSPLGGKRSLSVESTGAGAVPELPPKNCYLDHRGRRRMKTSPPPVRAKSPLIKTLSSNSSSSSYTAHADGHFLSSPDSPTDKELREIEELEENRDAVEPYYVKKVVFSLGEEEEEKRERQDTGAYEPVRSPLSVGGGEGEGEGPQEPDVGGVDEYVMMGSVMNGAWETTAEDGHENVVSCKSKTVKDRPEESYVEMQPVSLSNPNSPSPIGEDISRNAYELDDEPEPVYIEMNPEEFVPPTNKNNNKLYYASKDLLSHRPDLQAKKKKAKKLFHIGRK